MVTECPTAPPGRASVAVRSSPRNARARGPGFFALLKDLVEEIRLLFRQEIRLARAEIAAKARDVVRASTSVVIGAVVALLGVMALTAAAITGLWMGLIAMGVDPRVAVWLAPLIVGVVLAGAGAAVVFGGIATIRKICWTPEHTTRSLKETGRWIQDKVS